MKPTGPVAAWLLLVAWAAPAAAPSGQNPVRVRLFCNQQVRACTLSSDADLALADESGAERAVIPGGHAVSVRCQGGALLVEYSSKRFAAGIIRARSENGLIRVMDRPYRGEIALRSANGSIAAVNTLPLEDYLRSVVPAEIPRSFHPEVIKAQAVLSRTIAINWMGRHAKEGADFCDLTHCQVYAGASTETPTTDAAVAQTRGLIVTYRGQPAQVFYHSTCGGHTADASRAWPGAAWPRYLRGVPDLLDGKPACSRSPHLTWRAAVSHQEMNDSLGFPEAEIAVARREECGRVSEILVRWPDGEKRITGEQFHILLGRKLGWARVKSAWFEVKRRDDTWSFSGKGLGHGVGLCQWGANARCLKGLSCTQVLAHYFPGARLQRGDRLHPNDAGASRLRP